MSAKSTSKSPESVDNSNTYIITILVVSAIALCTRVNLATSNNKVTIQITSRIGNDTSNNSSFKNAIELNLTNPITPQSLDRAKNILSGREEIQGELLNYKFSVAHKNKQKVTSPVKTK